MCQGVTGNFKPIRLDNKLVVSLLLFHPKFAAMFEVELIKQISRLLRPSSETCLSDVSDRYSSAEVQRFNPIVRRQIRDLQQYGKSPRMRFLNTGSCRNEETTDMCALVQHGCNPGRKHPSSLKWTGQQVGAKCIHKCRSRQQWWGNCCLSPFWIWLRSVQSARYRQSYDEQNIWYENSST